MATLNVKGLPDDLYRRLQMRAKQQRRSIAQEVTRILEAALDASTSQLPNPDRFAALRGTATAGMTTDEIMALTRVDPG